MKDVEQSEKGLLDETQKMLVETKRSLTCQKDTAITLISFCKNPDYKLASNPFKDQTPMKILTRQYKLKAGNITPAWTGDSFIFPKDLFLMPAIADVLKSFYYFRANVKVMVKINATVYQAGACMLSFRHDVIGEGISGTIMEQSAQFPVVMNYSTSDTVEVEYDWMSPNLFTQAQVAAGQFGAIGKMQMRPLVVVNNTSGGSTTIPYMVYAQFVNPQVAGFISTTMAEAHSAEVPQTKSQTATPEQAEKSDGSNALLAIGGILGPIFRSIPIVGDVYAQVAKAVKTVGDVMDKPRCTKIAMKMTMDPTTDLANGSGLDLSNRLSLYPGSNLSKPPVDNMCMSTSHTVCQLAQIPMLHEYKVFNTTDDTLMLSVNPESRGVFNSSPEDVNNLQPDYLMYATLGHFMWRGSIKYMIHFITNAFTIARFRLSYLVDGTGGFAPEGGDFPSQIIEVKGTTIQKVVVPYLWGTAWRQVTSAWPGDGGYTPVNFPVLYLEMLANPSGILASSQIDVVVWRAAGPDFQLQTVQSYQNYPTAFTDADAHTSIQDEFKKPFDPVACDCTMTMESGYTSSEPSGRIVDIMRRYVSTDDFYPWVAVPSNWALAMMPLFWWGNLFRYQRGSVRYKVVVLGTTGLPLVALADTNGGARDLGRGCTAAKMQNDWVSIEVPYYSVQPYQVIDTDSTARDQQHWDYPILVDFTGSSIWQSVGDDFFMFYLYPPPAQTKYVPPPGKKRKNKIAVNKATGEV